MKVFGHRGACGYRPENTLESFELAFQQGAVAIECDLVPTKDHHLIIRHENELSHTTDIQSHPQFADRFKEVLMYGHWPVEGWFSEDFTLAEIKQLRAIERIPDERPGSAKFDGQFGIPTIEELLAADFIDGKTLIIEVKHGAHFAQLGFDMVGDLKSAIDSSDYKSRGVELVFESFNLEVTVELKQRIAGEHKYVFLVDSWGMPTEVSIDEFLDDVASKVDGISFNFDLLTPALVKASRERNLLIYTWTAQVEKAENSVEEYLMQFVDMNVDGVFTDQPDLLAELVAGLA
jgi:glycerophosphoryl diester phosphodiesterase